MNTKTSIAINAKNELKEDRVIESSKKTKDIHGKEEIINASRVS